MKILAVHPGARFSVADVYSGLTTALARRGHDIQEYRLDLRVDEAYELLNWREARKKRILRKEGTPYVPPVGGLMPQIIRHGSMTLLEATLTVNPHCLLIFSAMYLHPETLILLRRMGVPMVLILTESPYDDAEQGRLTPFVDYVYTNERASVALLRRWWRQTEGKRGTDRVEYLPHAYDPTVHVTTPSAATDDEVIGHDVVFVGSGFTERQETLQAVDWEGLGVDLGLYGKWPYVGSRNHLRKYIRSGVVPNEVTAMLYRRAKLGLNLYRQSVGTSRNATRIKGAESLNPRALELAATATPHVSDYRPEVEEVFGSVVPTFKTPADLERLIGDLLANPYARDEMRERLPSCVAGWTFDDRAVQVERGIAAARSVQSQ